jgi:hypothetical protein
MATWSEWPDSNRHIWVGGPWSCRWTTLALVRPTGNDPVPPRWQRGMRPPHPGRTWTGSSPAPHVTSVVKEPTLTSDGFTHTSNRRATRDSNPIAPAGRTGLRPAGGPSARTALWRQRQDLNPDPRALEARMLRYTTLPHVDRHVAVRSRDTSGVCRAWSPYQRRQTKKKAF